jgi:hypothetical protein
MHYSLFCTHESKAKMNNKKEKKTKYKEKKKERKKKGDKETKAKKTYKTHKGKVDLMKKNLENEKNMTLTRRKKCGSSCG